MEIFLLWVALSIVAGVIAGNKGRDGAGFFLLSMLLSPLIGILAAAAASPDIKQIERERVASGDSKLCPYCAELVKKAAAVCKHCGRDLPQETAPAPSKQTAPVNPAANTIIKTPDTHQPKITTAAARKKTSASLATIYVGLVVVVVYVIVMGAPRLSTIGSDPVRECIRRGITYFKGIDSYPVLRSEPNVGRRAEDVARERCNRSTIAFP